MRSMESRTEVAIIQCGILSKKRLSYWLEASWSMHTNCYLQLTVSKMQYLERDRNCLFPQEVLLLVPLDSK